ncbi:molybdopterin molybdotransferase MoeA [Methylotuvimicrobium alcaliphilum]|uniref:Molybdopterin molybdenumtransferase n=1 Tax=Methylotuvimicrobium alcaliphilum (strain DSM 19304 / NCIMB 14124 / VKM B-2133 / 20Z) TaxID=1091494 RepID=G4SW91_META2|nr:gephyrin-like molybdotransferase Glp [Methylotuvimicrobium alcaliphilum]CCE23006.1 Molybdopterin molybdenumtransferase [Methylotuvimicrobium alcaliphilum 20Z]
MIHTQPSCTDIFESGLMPCEEALSRILNNLPAIEGYQRLPIEKARGRVLHETVVSASNVPPHTNSAVDGYALHSSDLPDQGIARLAVKGIALAGEPFRGSIEKGTCLRIMTGAAMPEALDTVIMQEHAEIKDGFITIDSRHKAGQNVRRAGEDIKQGETVLASGKLLTPPDIGLLASLGICEVNVKRKLTVAIASTGNEIVAPHQIPTEAGIFDSNRYSLFAALDRSDIEIIDLGIIEDDAEVLLQRFNEAGRHADVIISTGGVSVGEADFTKTALKNSGQVDFWKVAIKPGRPLAFGRIGNAAFFGLPGNPVAVLVTFYFFVLPALEKMLGIVDKPIAPTLTARTTENLRKKPGRTEIQRGIVSRDENGDWIVKTTGKQGSGILMSMSKANAFIILNHQDTSKSAGDWVTVMPFCGMF